MNRCILASNHSEPALDIGQALVAGDDFLGTRVRVGDDEQFAIEPLQVALALFIDAEAKDALHNSLRVVIARPRAVCGVAFFANSYGYWLQNAPCIPSRSALSHSRQSYAEHP